MLKKKENLYNILFFGFGLFVILVLIGNNLVTNYQIIVKNDYIDQHIPFYMEFINLLEDGFPFWSWNLFLGTNFWASKAYYLIGDIYAWVTVLLNYFIKDLIKSLSIIFTLKLVITYTFIYIFLSKLKIKRCLVVVFSLVLVFSGWNTTFLEHPFYTSFYSIIPLILIGLYDFYYYEKHLILTISVVVLVSINFYLFWVISIFVLIIWLFQNIKDNTFKDLKRFFNKSFRLLFFYVLGVLMASVIWLPAIMHMIQTNRIGSYLIEYDKWSLLNVASLLTFSIIPRLNYYTEGIFKDTWYYFHQVSIYIGILTILLIPHSVYIFKNTRKNIAYLILLLLTLLLLSSPKIGLLFHFTYSLRYTLIISLIWFLIAIDVIHELKNIKLSFVIGIEIVLIIFYLLIKFYFIPTIYPTLPTHTEELHLLDISIILSVLYSTVLFFVGFFEKKKKKINYNIVFSIISIIMLFEISYFTTYVLSSHTLSEEDDIEVLVDANLENAINALKEYDNGFYRVHHNFNSSVYLNYENISLTKDFKTVVTYDSVYQYTLIDFLTWFRQYPNTSWHFRFSEPTFFKLLNVKYAIINTDYYDSNIDGYFANPIEGMRYGEYQIYKYKYNDYLAFSYDKFEKISVMNDFTFDDKYEMYQIADSLNTTLFIDDIDYDNLPIHEYENSTSVIELYPTQYANNYVEFNFTLGDKQALFFSIPYDEGWTIYDNDIELTKYNVQGGFIGLFLEKGNHQIKFKYISPGFKIGLFLSIISALCFIVLSFIKYRKFKK